ncbi:MAG: FAD-dependent oxidoreductase [Candidatus Krumholzibacteriota bacterium]|nr:FAD-dependent oxidoreductase [Candidatus Krumholzibacteriota bacterium]
MEKINVTINGQEIEAAPGKTILEVVRELGLDDIPTLCHSDELAPYGSCFLCVVEVKGRANLVPACATRIAPGMEVVTRNERIVASRRTALELLLSNHYADCVSPCMEGCPANVDAQGYIALSAMGLPKKAVDLIREANPLPAVCGRVCVRKCEVVCRREDVDRAVGINAIKRHVTDTPGIYDADPAREPDTGKTVGIVGAGPAGLTAAWFLGRRGHRAVMYEAMPRSGGMLRYGIPTYRLPDDVIDNEVDYICRAGAEIKYNVRVGKDVTMEELRRKHDAVFVANGAWTGKPMRVEGEFETEGVVSGVDFLVEKADDPSPVAGTVVVVGGGNTAMDVARTAWRCGADKVIILYRRTKAEMPADAMEIEDAIDEGIEILELAAPIGIVAEKGRLKALRCRRMKLGEPDDSGRRRPVPIEGSEFDQPCQLAVAAIGQDTVMDGLAGDGDGPELTRWKTFVVDTATMKTSVDGVFAGGDAADDGPTVVIDAIRDGQRAARAIHAFLTGEKPAAGPFVVRKEFWSKPGTAELGEVPESPRHEVHLIDVENRRGSFTEVATGFEYEDNVHETARCLSCGCVRFEDCSLRLYAEEYGVDMEKYKGYVRKHKVDERHPYIVYDPNKCVLCSRCIRTCARVLPISAIGLVNRGFRTEMRPAMNDPLVETSCVSCGNCVDACPTGALTVKYPFAGRASLATVDVPTHCGFCSLACPITVKRFGDGRYYIGPSGTPGEYLCRYGRFGHELFVKRARIAAAGIRDGSGRRAVETCDAHRRIVAGMRAAVAAGGADAVAVFVSPELTSEELYLAGRIAREGLGTNNVASLSIIGTGNEAGALDASFGFTASTADRSCLADADLVVCNNTSMESDHLVLAVDVIDAVRRGAGMIVANSTLDPADQILSTLALDPMRGRAAILWSGVARVLIDEGHIAADVVGKLPGAKDLLEKAADAAGAASMSGVDEERIRRAAGLIAAAKRIVFVHSPDRTQDAATGDMAALANLVVLLRAAGARADLLLPRNIANSAALEVAGADPAFAAGRVPSPANLAGARSHADLRRRLDDGLIRAAFVIGEDPLAWDKTGAWLRNVEFLAAMDWTETETTSSADVVLPGSTCLETAGTRCNFEGRVVEYARAVEPPAGVSGREILGGLAAEFGIGIDGGDAGGLRRAVAANLDGLAAFYWNTGEARTAPGGARLVGVAAEVESPAIQPPVTHAENYKREIREVGTQRYRVR